MTRIFTIGFTKKNASQFFGLLKDHSVTKLIDTRLNNVSQLADFAKKDDLKFFAEKICSIDYIHDLQLAPTAEMLSAFKKGDDLWNVYEKNFLNLLKQRKVEEQLNPIEFDGACLMCSEHLPHQCHRRLVAEYLRDKWKNVEIFHLT